MVKENNLLPHVISVLKENKDREIPFRKLVKHIRSMIKMKNGTRVFSSTIKKAINDGVDYGLLNEKDEKIKLLCKIKSTESVHDLTQNAAKSQNKNLPSDSNLSRGTRGRGRQSKSRSRSRSRSRSSKSRKRSSSKRRRRSTSKSRRRSS